MIIKGKKADLHIHSIYSDGNLTVEEIFNLAGEKEIDIISITDHDNISAISEAKFFSENTGIEFLNGVELSATFNGKEIHIINYSFDEKSEVLTNYLDEFSTRRVERLKSIINMFHEDGIEISLDDVLVSASQTMSVGRPHIASALVEKGYAKNFRDAFKKYIGDDKKYFIKKENESVERILEIIKLSGGRSFLAHPGQYLKGAELRSLLSLGFDGIEVVHPSHDKYNSNYFVGIAEEFGILQSGGSDFHGKYSQDFENFGKYYIPYYKIDSLIN